MCSTICNANFICAPPTAYQDLINALKQQHIGLHDPNIELAVAQGDPIQVADLSEGVRSAVNNVILRAGFRALLVAPLIRGEDVIGMLVFRRRTPGAFPQITVDLIKTFAAQSAVAIENARYRRIAGGAWQCAP